VSGDRANMTVSIATRAGRGESIRTLSLVLLFCLVVLTAIWGMTVGSSMLPAAQVIDAFVRYDGSREHVVVVFVRLPRVLAGVLVGASLAVAGAIMQAATNNPLASPGLLGINAGAAFAVVMAIILVDAQSSSSHAWYAFAGAAVAAVAVYAAGSVGPGGATPLKLALAGAVLSSFLTALTTAVLIFDRGTLDQIRLWSAGSLAGRPLSSALEIAPYTIIGLGAAFLFRRQVMTLSLGADIARSVGQNALLWRALAAGMVVLLAGSAVALAGPIGFVGLVVPHIARLIVRADYRWVIPFSALGGALLLVSADGLARYALPQQTLPVGVTMALIGAPFFIYLARYRIGGAP
jgi:iron complex transport system permease protein